MSERRRPGDWNCPKCNHLVFKTKSTCFKCNYSKSGSREADIAKSREDWTCPDCYCKWSSSKKECEECGKWNPRDETDRREGDWTCPKSGCGSSVFASKSRCFRCGTAREDRPSSAGSASGSSSGSAYEKRDGDWKCAGCGFGDNFSRRPTCLKCDKPKDWKPKEDSPHECSICMDTPVQVVITTCKHACMCEECSKSLVSRKCPICQKPFEEGDVEKIYLC